MKIVKFHLNSDLFIPLRFLSTFLSESIHRANHKLLLGVPQKGQMQTRSEEAGTHSPQSLPDPTIPGGSRAGDTSGPVVAGAPVS